MQHFSQIVRRVCTSVLFIIIIMAGLNACGLQSKLLITPLSEWSHTIIKLQAWCSLKSVTTTLGILFSWLHILLCTVVVTLGNLDWFPSYSCLVYKGLSALAHGSTSDPDPIYINPVRTRIHVESDRDPPDPHQEVDSIRIRSRLARQKRIHLWVCRNITWQARATTRRTTWSGGQRGALERTT